MDSATFNTPIGYAGPALADHPFNKAHAACYALMAARSIADQALLSQLAADDRGNAKDTQGGKK